MAKENTPAWFNKSLDEASNKSKLKTLRKEIAEGSITKDLTAEKQAEMLRAIDNKITSIKTTGESRKKKAKELGGAPAEKKVEDITNAAVAEATEVKNETAEEIAQKFKAEHGEDALLPAAIAGEGVVDKTPKKKTREERLQAIDARKKKERDEQGVEHDEGSPAEEIATPGTLENGNEAFAKTYEAPELHADRQEQLNTLLTEESPDEKTAAKKTKTAATTTTNTSTNTNTTSTNAQQTAPTGTNEDNTGAPTGVEENEDGPKNLDEARAAFFAAYKQVEKETGVGFKAARFFRGDDRREGIDADIEEKNPELFNRYFTSQAQYRSHLAQEATKMLESGKSKADVEEMIYNELKAKQESLDPIIPEKVRNIASRGLGWYTKMPKPARIILSTAIAVAIVGASGKVAGAGLATYGLKRLTTLAVGGAIGQGLVSLKNRVWNANKDAEKIKAATHAEMQEKIGSKTSLLLGSDIIALENLYQKRLDKEHNAKLKHLAVDFGIRMFAGFGTRFAADSILGGGDHVDDGGKKGGDGKLVPPKPVQPPAPAPIPKPEDSYVFKEIKVDYSSRGSIDTWAHIKSELKDAYKGVDPSKVPPEYKHIMESRADSLAKEFGEWRPDAADGKESLNMLKGSSIEFDKTGKIISHSLRTVSGGTEDQTLMDVKSAGNDPVINQQANERFFHYGGVKAEEVVTPTVPFDETATQPTFESGIQPTVPFGGVDNNGFWSGGTGQGHAFESHVSHESAGTGDDKLAPESDEPTAWDGKRHSKLWWKHHPDGHDLKAEARHAAKLAKIAAAQQAAAYPPQYNAGYQIDNAFRQAAYNSGGYVDEHPIMNPANPSGAPIAYQHHEVYGSHLNEQQVSRILHNPVRFVGDDFLLRAVQAHDPAYPLYKVLHDLQAQGFGFRPNESVEEYFGRARITNQEYFAKMNVDAQDWFVRNGFYN